MTIQHAQVRRPCSADPVAQGSSGSWPVDRMTAQNTVYVASPGVAAVRPDLREVAEWGWFPLEELTRVAQPMARGQADRIAAWHSTQTELSRVSGVEQPSISQYLSGKIDERLNRLLTYMGYRVEVVRRPIKIEVGRSLMRSWRVHRQLSMHLSPKSLGEWRPLVMRNLDLLRQSTQGQPYLRNLDRGR